MDLAESNAVETGPPTPRRRVVERMRDADFSRGIERE
jgi:hypothetical protein